MGDTSNHNINLNSAKVYIKFFINNRYKLNIFLVQLKIIFILNNNKFNYKVAKIIYIVVYLRESIFNWFKLYIIKWLTKKKESSKAIKKFFRNFNNFKKELYTIYSTIDKA